MYIVLHGQVAGASELPIICACEGIRHTIKQLNTNTQYLAHRMITINIDHTCAREGHAYRYIIYTM